MDNNISAIENSDDLCWKCLKHCSHINTIEFGNLGYNSTFDEWGSQIQLCDECLAESKDVWNLQIIDEDNMCGGKYEHEEEMWDYIKSLPIQTRELLKNTYSYGSNACYKMESQDWIDYELNILSHEKCKEYGLQSSQEIKAYKDRFSTCDKVYKMTYLHDGHSRCQCEHGAFESSISNKCYMCCDYIPRKGTMKETDELNELIESEKIRLTEMYECAKRNLELLESDPYKYFISQEVSPIDKKTHKTCPDDYSFEVGM